jgi:alkylation response protein AidB-like acyl-CoA dehydrogenase
MSVNNSLVCAGMEILFRRTKMKYLVPLAKIGAFCLSQKQEVMQTSKKTTAIDKGDYLLNGTKNWITNGSTASTI